MRYKTAIFDMDGTILNTLDDLTDSVNAAMRWAHAPERTEDEVRSFIGNGAYKLMERSLPEGTSRKRIEEVLSFYRPYYETHAENRTAPYPGIPNALAALKKEGVRLAVVSNKPDGAVKRLASRFFPNCFDAVLGDRPGMRVKPQPDLLLVGMSLTRADRESTVYIGDSEVDIETAENTGVDCISVSWGYRDEDLLHSSGAKRIAHTAGELYSMIMSYTSPLL